MSGNKDYASRGDLYITQVLPGGSLGLEQKAAEIPGFDLEIANDRGEVITTDADGIAGFSAGVVKTKVTAKTALPKKGSGGRTIPLDKYVIENANLAFTLRLDNGDRYVVYGVLLKCKIGFEVGKTIYKDFEFSGGKPQLMTDNA